MHRSFEITAPSEVTDQLVEELERLEGVVTLSVRRGDGVKPRGDVISATVLNTETDAVLSCIVERRGDGAMPSVVTSSVDTLLSTESQEQVNHDHDEAAWEEAETAMRRHTRLNLNFFATSAAGAVLAACGVITTSKVTEATALVAAGVVAPAFEPLARAALAIVTRRWAFLFRGLRSMLAGYVVMVAAAVLTMLALRAGSHHFVLDFTSNTTFHEVEHPPAINLVISACGAIAGVIMVAAGRFTQLAGALIALQLLPALASIGVALEIGQDAAAARSLGRLGIDVGMVLVAGLIVFTLKHVTVHSRRAVLH